MKTKLRILFVEDSPEDTLLAARELERQDYEISYERVETETALKSALAREPWDAVLCDYTMPQFSGGSALRVVTQLAPDVPFIYVSGTIGEDVAVEAIKSGAHDYVMKRNLKRLPGVLQRGLEEAHARRRRRLLENDRDQLLGELEAALHRSEKLSGLVPICKSCRRIRERDGTWMSVETYIQARSEVHFVRCLCPECRPNREEPPPSGDWLDEEL
jgi:DNA-binding NtrC family response regulator